MHLGRRIARVFASSVTAQARPFDSASRQEGRKRWFEEAWPVPSAGRRSSARRRGAAFYPNPPCVVQRRTLGEAVSHSPGHVGRPSRAEGARGALPRTVTVGFDPSRASAASLTRELEAAGYVPGEIVEPDLDQKNKPEWASNGSRVTFTNELDLAMSGDYRKY